MLLKYYYCLGDLMKRVLCVLAVLLIVFSVCGCENSPAAEFTPKDSGVVVYPDKETAETVNGYLEKEEIEETPTTREPQFDGILNSSSYYYVNINSKKFHYPDCRYAQKMNSSSLRLENDYNKLIDEGFVPCKVCKP